MGAERVEISSEQHDAARAGDQPYYEGQKEAEQAEAAATEQQQQEQQPEGEKPEGEQQQQQPEQQTEAEKQPEAEAEAAEESAPEAEAPSALDYNKFAEEFTQTGELSAESRKAITDALPNLPPEIVDTYLEGLKALQTQVAESVFNMVGGKDEYTAMLHWAKENLSQPEQDAYDSALERGEGDREFAIRGLHERYLKAGGSSAVQVPDLTPGAPASGGNAAVQQIRSRQELVQLIRDPRYKRDPSFREAVDGQLAAALRSGNYTTS